MSRVHRARPQLLQRLNDAKNLRCACRQSAELRSSMATRRSGSAKIGGSARRALITRGLYPTGIKVTNQELQAVLVVRDKFQEDWHYPIEPA